MELNIVVEIRLYFIVFNEIKLMLVNINLFNFLRDYNNSLDGNPLSLLLPELSNICSQITINKFVNFSSKEINNQKYKRKIQVDRQINRLLQPYAPRLEQLLYCWNNVRILQYNVSIFVIVLYHQYFGRMLIYPLSWVYSVNIYWVQFRVQMQVVKVVHF